MAVESSAFSLLTIIVIILFNSVHLAQSMMYPDEIIDSSFVQPSASPTSSLLPLSPSLSPAEDSDQYSDETLAPALFVIGDSSVDCGNNNFLGTFARADHLPYGRDFDTGRPSGRFCNGRIPVDYLGQ